ncbi:MAG: hypothetical protein ACYTFG_20690 [Planctomycetota bacterium]|jgi:hypothetical protein
MRTTLILFLALAAGRTSLAEVNVGYTAEWLAHKSSLIAVAVPVKVENVKGPGQVWFTRTRFRLEEVVKGAPCAGDTITVHDISTGKKDVLSLEAAARKKTPFLVFAAVTWHTLKAIEGKYAFTETHVFKSAFREGKPVENIYTPDFKILPSYERLLDRARKQVERENMLIRNYWKGTIEKRHVEVPHESEAFGKLYSGSSCFLLMPEYKEAAKKKKD